MFANATLRLHLRGFRLHLLAFILVLFCGGFNAYAQTPTHTWLPANDGISGASITVSKILTTSAGDMFALAKASGEYSHSLFRSTNNGQSWQYLRDTLTDNVLVEEHGTHLCATEQQIYQRYDFWSEKFVDEIHPVLVHSIDRGESWNTILGYGIVTDISSNSRGSIAVGFSKSIYNQGTTTGDIGVWHEGDTAWQFVDSWQGPEDGSLQSTSQAVSNVIMLEDNSVLFTVYAHGDGGFEKGGLFRLSPDGIIQTIRTDFFVEAIERTPDGNLIAAIEVFDQYTGDIKDRGLYRSTDNGNSWMRVFSLPQHNNDKPNFYIGPNGQTIFSLWYQFGPSQDEPLYRSTDYGISWSQIQVDDSISPLKGFVFHPDGSIFSCNHHSVFFSGDNGTTWTPITNELPSPAKPQSLGIAVGRPQTLAVSDNGKLFCGVGSYGIYRLEYTTSVKQDNARHSQQSLRLLASNNSEPTVQFTLQQAGTVSLKLYDVIGREVLTILNEHRNAGEHQIQFSPSELVTGTYLLVLTTEQLTESVRFYR